MASGTIPTHTSPGCSEPQVSTWPRRAERVARLEPTHPFAVPVRAMNISTIARYHPFLWLGGFTLVVMVVGRWIPLAYDDRGLGTAWYLFTYVLTFVFQVASDLAQRLVGAPPRFVPTPVLPSRSGLRVPAPGRVGPRQAPERDGAGEQ